jgi:hypothetical protein
MHVISLGAGVQSSTMALMAASGAITPMPQAAIFADTQDEPASVYRWLDWLEGQVPFPVHRVTAGALRAAATNVRTSRKSGNTYIAISLPVYTKNGLERGQGRRQCTRTFKVDVIRRRLRELRAGRRVVQWIGISWDEAIRMKPSRDKWCENRWPLVDMELSRDGCLRWMEDAGYPKPPRSACVYCPFHNDAEWARLRSEEPAEFEKAVAFERSLQAAYAASTALDSVPYLHASRAPLDAVTFRPRAHQTSLFGNNFGNECEGLCGV